MKLPRDIGGMDLAKKRCLPKRKTPRFFYGHGVSDDCRYLGSWRCAAADRFGC